MTNISDSLHPRSRSYGTVKLECQSGNLNSDVKATENQCSGANVVPDSDYLGEALENWVLNTNMQEFVQQVSYISGLETAGKLSPEEASQQIKALWKQLKHTEKQLGIGEHLVEGKPTDDSEY